MPTPPKKKILEQNKEIQKGPGALYITNAEFSFDEDLMSEILKQMTISFFYYFKEELKRNLKSYLTYRNFMGEADNYINSNKEIVLTTQSEINDARIRYAKAIFAEFSANLDSVIEYNEDENLIELSPFIADLEYGTFYRPALGIVSKAYKQFMANLQKDIDKMSLDTGRSEQEIMKEIEEEGSK